MKKTLNVFAIIISVISIFCALSVMYVAINSELDILYIVETVSCLFSLLYAFVYLINGYKKDFAKYYKVAMIVNAINALVVTALSSNEATKYISIISCAICFGAITTLALAKNLGKNTSLLLCGIVIVLRTMGIISAFIAHVSMNIDLIIMLSQLVLSLVILLATIAKYVDKDERHTI